MVVEICATSLKSLINAQKAGADRLELCENYLSGGITPNIDFVSVAIKKSQLPINILIRPRAGNFYFNDFEFNQMIESINNFKNYNVNGFVVGFLNNYDQLDKDKLQHIRNVTKGYELTFHRAFDYVKDYKQSLELLIENEFDRILCSGCTEDSFKGINKLKELDKLSNDRIVIMPGGGVNIENFMHFKNANFKEVHLSAINKMKSLDSDYNIIKRIVEMSKQ